MSSAKLAAKRSKDPIRTVGAVIVNERKRIVGVGYNGFPYGTSDDTGLWCKDNPDPWKNKGAFVCHAEVNAILNSDAKQRGCTMHTTLFPCNECAKIIVQSGIKRVVWCDIKRNASSKVAVDILKSAGVKMERYNQ